MKIKVIVVIEKSKNLKIITTQIFLKNIKLKKKNVFFYFGWKLGEKNIFKTIKFFLIICI